MICCLLWFFHLRGASGMVNVLVSIPRSLWGQETLSLLEYIYVLWKPLIDSFRKGLYLGKDLNKFQNLNRWTILERSMKTSSSANLLPTHMRVPWPNGRLTKGWTACFERKYMSFYQTYMILTYSFSDFIHLSGRNTSGLLINWRRDGSILNSQSQFQNLVIYAVGCCKLLV